MSLQLGNVITLGSGSTALTDPTTIQGTWYNNYVVPFLNANIVYGTDNLPGANVGFTNASVFQPYLSGPISGVPLANAIPNFSSSGGVITAQSFVNAYKNIMNQWAYVRKAEFRYNVSGVPQSPFPITGVSFLSGSVPGISSNIGSTFNFNAMDAGEVITAQGDYIPLDNTINFPTPGRFTWQVPANVNHATFTLVGGGGGGGAGTQSGAGAGGSTLIGNIAVTPATTYTIAVGGGGIAGGGGNLTQVISTTGSFTVPAGVTSLTVTYPQVAATLTIGQPTSSFVTQTLTVTPGDVIPVTIGGFGSGSTFGTINTTAYTLPVVRIQGNVDDTDNWSYNIVSDSGVATQCGGGQSAVTSCAAAQGITISEFNESRHGDLYATATMYPAQRNTIIGSVQVTLTSFSGRGSFGWTNQSPVASNDYNIGWAIYDGDRSEGYYDYTITLQQQVPFFVTYLAAGGTGGQGQIINGESFSGGGGGGSPAASGGTQIYSTAGGASFTVPAGVTQITVTLVGGGGGGQTGWGNGQSNSGGGGAGGAAGQSVSQTITVTPGQVISIIIGAGGGGGARGIPYPGERTSDGPAGANGASTSLTYGSTTITATGGVGGAKWLNEGASPTGGSGYYPGSSGTFATGQAGADSTFGTGGAGSTSIGVAGGTGGNGAGGGGGAAQNNGDTQSSGGDGGAGIVVITWTGSASTSPGGGGGGAATVLVNPAGTPIAIAGGGGGGGAGGSSSAATGPSNTFGTGTAGGPGMVGQDSGYQTVGTGTVSPGAQGSVRAYYDNLNGGSWSSAVVSGTLTQGGNWSIDPGVSFQLTSGYRWTAKGSSFVSAGTLGCGFYCGRTPAGVYPPSGGAYNAGGTFVIERPNTGGGGGGGGAGDQGGLGGAGGVGGPGGAQGTSGSNYTSQGIAFSGIATNGGAVGASATNGSVTISYHVDVARTYSIEAFFQNLVSLYLAAYRNGPSIIVTVNSP